jgi:flagellar biosynthesis/type III secretory pathway chaperone
MDELYYTLDKLIALHRNLADLLREEFSHMVKLDAKSLTEATQTKEVLLNEIWNHEQLRARAADRIAVSLSIDPKQASLGAIAEASSAEDREKLKNLGNVLVLLVREAKELNTRNMDFAENSLVRIEDMKRNVLGLSNNTPKENYSNSGSRQPISEQGGRLLSTEA